MIPLLDFIIFIIDLYYYVVIAAVVLSLLIAFDIVPRRNEAVYAIGQFLNTLTEPAFSRVRRYIPPVNGIDFSPLVIIILLIFIKSVVISGFLKPMFFRLLY
jgi:YggT family protein